MKVYNYKIVGMLFILFSVSSYSQQDSVYFYYYKGEKIFLKPDTSTIALSIESNKSPEAITLQNVSREKLTIHENNTRRLSKIIDQQAKEREHIKTYYAEIPATPVKNKEEYRKQIETYKKGPSIIMASPCFVSHVGGKIGLSNNFYVKLKDKKDVDLLYEKAKELFIEVLGHNEFMPLWFTLSCGKSTNINAMEAANLFHETGLFENAEPEFMYHNLNSPTNRSRNILSDTLQKSIMKSKTALPQSVEPNFLNRDLAASPNDPYYRFQWGLKNNGNMLLGIPNPSNYLFDIKAEKAWSITKGSSNIIKIAVIDSGIQIDHPDLKDNIFGKGYDTETNSSPSKVYNFHGTCVAGIIGAIQNNSIGISGVATNCKIIPVSIDVNNFGNQAKFTSNLLWSIDNGADVINMSFGAGIPNTLSREALELAATKGRDGKGTVLVGSAGNNNLGGCSFPAGEENVLAVGDIDFLKRDPYSNHGVGLDLMAPGEDIITTNLIGKGGMTSKFPDPDYTLFYGTSAAAPFVSGVAALVLSVNPELTAVEVRNIIKKSAQKIRSDIYTYSNTSEHPNGTWNNEMGHGLVNAYAAVKLAKASLTCLENVVITKKNTLAPKSDKEQGKGQILESSILNSNDNTQASKYIIASNAIEEGENVIYHAGKSVELIPGFIAKSGCVFEADIEACLGNSLHKTNTFFKEKITYAFRYNSAESIIAKNQNVNNQNQLKVEPNPFTNTITISYSTTANSEKVSLEVYTLTGIKVATLIDQDVPLAGTHTAEWNAGTFSSGTYLVTLTTPHEKKTLKAVKL